MGEASKISWTDNTFNAWAGCIKVSPGCEHCYAERESKRFPETKGVWGPEGKGTRVVFSEAYWDKPRLWDAKAAKDGRRTKIFTSSIADVFEQWDGPMHDTRGGVLDATMDAVRLRLFRTIMLTPNLDWLVLTKRIEEVMPTLERLALRCRPGELCDYFNCWLKGSPPHNIWLGTTAEDQEWADRRIPVLLEIPAAVRWVSYEPALGPVDWSRWCKLDWIIVGGESGPHARRFNLAWARDTIRQCREAGAACFVKQMGSEPRPTALPSDMIVRFAKHPAGADPAEWPRDLQIQQFPDLGD